MNLAIVQIRSEKGNIPKNIALHKKAISEATSERVKFILFSELSLTGYEPKLASKLAVHSSSILFKDFEMLSTHHDITIAFGTPLKKGTDVQIGMLIFRPNHQKLQYIKQYLHKDELPYFAKGDEQILFSVKNYSIASAICYESILPNHIKNACDKGAKLYAASVAKSRDNVRNAHAYYSKIAKNTIFL